MMKMIVFALLGTLALPAIAQDAPMAMPQAAPVCPRDAAPIPAALSPWADRKPLTAATDKVSLGKTMLAPGTAVDLALADTPAVTYVVRPSHPGGSVSHGGMLTLTVGSAGTYRVAIGSGAWLDLVKDGISLESVAHGHGPACSGVRKMVDFALQSGVYVLQVAGNGDAQLPLLIAKLP
jgi:hypothetical protein